MEQLAADYSDQLARVDGGIRAMVARVRETDDADEIQAACEFSNSLRELAHNGGEGLGALEQFRQTLKGTSQLSSAIRPVLRRMDQAVGSLIPSRETFQQWSREMDAALDEVSRTSSNE
jgi:hypothetical protein